MLPTKIIVQRIIDLPAIMIGLAIVKLPFLNSYKIHLLSTWQDEEKRNIIDNLLFKRFFGAWIRFEYLNETDPDKREVLKSHAMGGESGKNWAESYQNQFSDSGYEGGVDLTAQLGRMNFDEAAPVFTVINTILEQTESHYQVIQIGSSSGKEITYFAKRFPQHEFVGTDIYEEVLNYSSHYHKQPNLTFKKCSAKDIANTEEYNILSKKSKILIFADASLQYVQPEHLSIFFNSLGQFRNLKILLLEPVDLTRKPDQMKQSVFRANFSYTHDYKWYAEKAGFQTVKYQIIAPYVGYSTQQNTGHYFFYGKTK